MTNTEIKDMQLLINDTGLIGRRIDVDGTYGPQTRQACEDHLIALMPSDHPFPYQKDVASFYGERCKPPTKKIQLPYPIFYDGREVTTLSPHEKCADSLERVFQHLAQLSKIIRPVEYNGIYICRNMRAGGAPSMHSWAIAIDLNASTNRFKDHWPLQADMPFEVMECFAKEGWESAGAFWNYDAMHAQATKPNNFHERRKAMGLE